MALWEEKSADPALALCEAAMVSSRLKQPRSADLCNCLSEATVPKDVIKIFSNYNYNLISKYLDVAKWDDDVGFKIMMKSMSN